MKMNIFLANKIVGIVVWLVNVVFFGKRKIRGSPIGPSEFEYEVYGARALKPVPPGSSTSLYLAANSAGL